MKKLSKKSIDGIIENNKGKTIREFLDIQDELAWQDMIDSGRIFDKTMDELFYGKTKEEVQRVMNEIDLMDLMKYHDRDQNFKDKMKEWLKSYGDYSLLADSKRKFDVLLPKQLLALHYLLKMFDKGFEDIHGDKTKQAKILSIIFGKSEDNIRKALSNYLQPSYSRNFYKKENLNHLVDILNDLKRSDLADDIESHLKDNT